MAQGTTNFTECIPANLRLLDNRQDYADGNEGKRTSDTLSGPHAQISRLWHFDKAQRPDRGTLGANALTSPEIAVTPSHVVSDKRTDDLTDADIDNLNAVLGHEIAENTIKNYRVQWRSFIVWAVGKGVRALPAEPALVAAYLAERIEEHGHKPATLRVAASAIAFVHRASGHDDPCSSPEVKRTLRSATRKVGKRQKQAKALTAEAMTAIQLTACKPRRGRGGRVESRKTAMCRGTMDIALISLMRDAMLRISEAAVLKWRDVAAETDGTGRLLIRRSKTDAEGEGSVAFLSIPTMSALTSMCGSNAGTDSVFGLRPNQISKRIKQAAEAAGLGGGFSGHSPRVGMARDLARAGIELPSLMTAGRWRSPTMPAHYTRNETAGKGAVAQYHGYWRRVA